MKFLKYLNILNLLIEIGSQGKEGRYQWAIDKLKAKGYPEEQAANDVMAFNRLWAFLITNR